MDSLKRKISFYFISVVGCSFFAALFLVKIVKNLSTVSLSEIGLAFLFAICAMICGTLYSDAKVILKSGNKNRIS